MSGRGVGSRDRLRRDHIPPPSSSSREKSRGNNPPSRHLWVGNLSHHITEPTLANHFLRFGELESVAFQPGRSYAFINFQHDDDAIAAMDALQGFSISGLPLKIEFAKADKSPAPSRGESYLQSRDEQHFTNRSNLFPQRESRKRHASPDAYLPDNTPRADDSAPPSEVLWIGFPAFLKVDDTILRKAFSPFGEIEKITVFSGRKFAFVRFRNLLSACRAKETLQGKLFGNPRVHICFAKSETGSSNIGRQTAGRNAPSPGFMLNGRAGSFDDFRPTRNFGKFSEEPPTRPSRFIPNTNDGDLEAMNFCKKERLWSGGADAYARNKFPEHGADMGLQDSSQQYQSGPFRDWGNPYRESPQSFPKRSPVPEEPWDSPEDSHLNHGAKRLKMDRFPPDNELPEYMFSGSEKSKHVFPRPFLEYGQQDEPGPLGSGRVPNTLMNINKSFGDRSDLWTPPHLPVHPSLGSLSSIPVEQKRPTPDFHRPLPGQEWKWEGTIAKGGTPVCRARCFPVGKVMDFMLPEHLDFTARTSLDMLGKHYYEAVANWVVFFVPESDADIGHYNEFMNYLGEKQRSAVAKIDERNTLFLVPPSDFSEKVLKVPGKLSISGVVLRLEAPSSNMSSYPASRDRKDGSFMSSSHDDMLYSKSKSQLEPFPPMATTPSQSSNKPVLTSPYLPVNASSSTPSSLYPGYSHAAENMSDIMEKSEEYPPHHRNTTSQPSWSIQQAQSSVLGARNAAPLSSMFGVDPASQEHRVDPVSQNYLSHMQREMQEPNAGIQNIGFGINSGSNKPSLQEGQSSASVSMPFGSLNQEQLLQLASSLIGQQNKGGNSVAGPSGQNFQSNMMNQLENSSQVPQRYSAAIQSNQVSHESFMPQSDQQQQLSNAATRAQSGEVRQGDQQVLNNQHDGDVDPQKRLESTLQLAAALLQQIRQGKAT